MPIDLAEIRYRLVNQAPRSAVVHDRLDAITDAACLFGAELAKLPEGRDKSLAVTHLEDSVARAKKAIALAQHEVDPDAGPAPA